MQVAACGFQVPLAKQVVELAPSILYPYLQEKEIETFSLYTPWELVGSMLPCSGVGSGHVPT